MLDLILLQIAKASILTKFDSKYAIDRVDILQSHPFLGEKRATFVTLNYNHQLRGCIGSIIAHKTLLVDIMANALSAAFGDPRFPPLDKTELTNSLSIEISVLTPPEILEYDDFDDLVQKIKPNIDGLILKFGNFQGTFLPQVWLQLPSTKEFLEHLSIKAGANQSIYKQHPAIYRYKVDSIENSFEKIKNF
ncbi:MAG: AmmeMemoRadiSam system protein A [Epsilonproteobacteria bacterium]|nr:AmmeMemoRadiSam system protein A [Campylobacterota bacterium]